MENPTDSETPAPIRPWYVPEHLKRWEMPRNYAGEVWPNYYSFLGRSRDSDCLEECNFVQGLKRLGGESETVLVIRENHWAVGWVEWIGIHQDDAAALRLADEIKGGLEDYPVVDEDALSEAEMEEANTVWRDCYNLKDRVAYVRAHRSQFEFQGLGDMLGCLRGSYFAGYASELIYR